MFFITSSKWSLRSLIFPTLDGKLQTAIGFETFSPIIDFFGSLNFLDVGGIAYFGFAGIFSDGFLPESASAAILLR